MSLSPSSGEAFVQQAFDLMDEMEGLTSERAIRDKLFVLLSRCGLEHFVVARLPQPRQGIGPKMLLKRWPAAWEEFYNVNDLYQHDPVSKHCFQTVDPFMWTSVRYDRKQEPRRHEVMAAAAAHHLREGLCIPLHDAAGFQAVVSMAGSHVELPPKARRAIHLLSIYAYGAADRLQNDGRSHHQETLSAREREVLTWLAIGKTLEDVGDRLSIATSTAETHLKRSKMKLGTTNTTHTVVEAIRRRQIKL